MVWDPLASFKVRQDKLLYKNKLSPYFERTLQGIVQMTIVRGNIVYAKGQIVSKPIGQALLDSHGEGLPKL